MQPLNPYIVGNAVGGGSAFVGRNDILQEVYRTLQHPGHNAILLHGQRRIGKTSILRELEAKLPTKGNYCPIFFDLLGKAHQSISQIVQELANHISDKLGQGKPQLGPDPKSYFYDTWLPNLLQTEEKTFVLLFDEFDALEDELGKQTRGELFRYLSDLLAIRRDRLNVVFVIGRNISDLTEVALAFFKGVQPKPVSLLNKEDTLKLINLSQNTLQWTTKAEERVYQLTQGHPYLTQQVCHCVWEHLYRDRENITKTPSVSLKHIEEIIPIVLERSEGALNWLWDGLEAAQKVFLSAMAVAGDKTVTKTQINASLSEIGIKVSVPPLENAPKLLLLDGWDLLIEERNGYRFKVELLRLLGAKYKPLYRVKDELNRLEPEANSYYESALKLRTEKQLEEALEKLGRVLRLNPNHIDTVKLQAEILLEQGKLTEAHDTVKNLLGDHPDEARPLLIQTLWARAQDSKNENEQLGFYQEILKLDSHHAGATKEVKKIWRRRAEKAVREDDYKGAIHAYQRAGMKDNVSQMRKKYLSRKYSKPMRIGKEFFFGFVLVWIISYVTPEGNLFLGYGSDKIVLKAEKQKDTYRLIYDENPLVGKPKPLSLIFQDRVEITLEDAKGQKVQLTTTNLEPPYTYEISSEEQQKLLSDDNNLPLVFSIPLGSEKKKLQDKPKCEVKNIFQEKLSCEVKDKPLIDIPFFLKNIAWQFWAILAGIFAVLIGEGAIFRKRPQREVI